MKKYIILSVLALGITILVGYNFQLTVQKKTTLSANASPQPDKQINCIDEPEGKPVITSLSTTSAKEGTNVEIFGCNFSGFEGDKKAWIENEKGVKGLFFVYDGSTSKHLRITLEEKLCQTDTTYSDLPCDAWLPLVPGAYKIFVDSWGKVSNKIEFTIDPPLAKSTPITYYILDKINTNQTFCNGDNMDSAGFKAALTKKINIDVPNNLTTEEKIIKTLSLAAAGNSFNKPYTRIEEISYKNNIVYMGPVEGWAGSSIFYCAWKPFVEKNLEQFEDVKEIIWDAFPAASPKKTVKIFFNNTKFDPGLTNCSKVYSVNRFIEPTSAVARAALEELLKGPTVSEKNIGYLNNLNSGIKIQKLTIENGIAKVDFSAELEKNVGGSCRTGAIIAQIKETLKQFPTVQDVVISIDGRIEDILQP